MQASWRYPPRNCINCLKTLENFHEIDSIVTNKPHQRMIWIATSKKQRVGYKLVYFAVWKRLDYKKANAIPHMYSMVDHNSKFFDTKKSVKLFTVQGVEKKTTWLGPLSYTIQQIGCCNWCVTAGVNWRQWKLWDKERSKRPYSKNIPCIGSKKWGRLGETKGPNQIKQYYRCCGLSSNEQHG